MDVMMKIILTSARIPAIAALQDDCAKRGADYMRDGDGVRAAIEFRLAAEHLRDWADISDELSEIILGEGSSTGEAN